MLSDFNQNWNVLTNQLSRYRVVSCVRADGRSYPQDMKAPKRIRTQVGAFDHASESPCSFVWLYCGERPPYPVSCREPRAATPLIRAIRDVTGNNTKRKDGRDTYTSRKRHILIKRDTHTNRERHTYTSRKRHILIKRDTHTNRERHIYFWKGTHTNRKRHAY
jgi:hypothetical protein